MNDVIRLIGLSFYGYHGCGTAEKETGRVFEVDCEMATDLSGSGVSDDLADTVDYSQVYTTIKDVVEGRSRSLLEALATEIAGLLLDKFPIERVTLTVRKLHPPIVGHLKHVEVEITRRRGDLPTTTG